MKKTGSNIEFSAERDSEIMERFSQRLSQRKGIDPSIYKEVVEMPASRFWVSEPRAAYIVGKSLKGYDFSGMFEEKRLMFEEITRRVRRIIKDDPGVTIASAVFQVVNSEAPRFYISPETAKSIIYRVGRERRRSGGRGQA